MHLHLIGLGKPYLQEISLSNYMLTYMPLTRDKQF